MPYTIIAKPAAITGLHRLERGIAGTVSEKIDRLRTDPIPADAEVIPFTVNMYRIRVLDRAVEYQVDHAQRVINLLSVA